MITVTTGAALIALTAYTVCTDLPSSGCPSGVLLLDVLGSVGLYYLNYGGKEYPNTQQFKTVQNLHKYSLSQDERYRLTLELIEYFPDDVAPYIPRYALTPKQEKEIAFRLAKNEMANISRDIHHFTFLGQEVRKEIVLVALETHPTKVYENLAKYDFPNTEFLSEHFTAYDALAKEEPVLEKALTYVQQITQKSSLPEVFLRGIERVIETRLKRPTQQEVVELVRTLNQYPSAITLSLVTLVDKRIQTFFPKLSNYCYSEMGFVQLNGKGFDYLARSIKGMHILMRSM